MAESSILFFTEGINFVLKDKKKLRNWINTSIGSENKSCGSINYIFCTDEFLHKLNIEYLNHNTLTDIISFGSSEDPEIISGEMYISIHRIKDNAKQFKVAFVNELHRVMIHGILHLIGYNDKTEDEKKLMRLKEDYYLSLLPEFF